MQVETGVLLIIITKSQEDIMFVTENDVLENAKGDIMKIKNIGIFLLIGHGIGNAISFFMGYEFPYAFYVLCPIFLGLALMD